MKTPHYESILLEMIEEHHINPAPVLQCFIEFVCKNKTREERDRFVQKIALSNNFFGYWSDSDYEDDDSSLRDADISL